MVRELAKKNNQLLYAFYGLRAVRAQFMNRGRREMLKEMESRTIPIQGRRNKGGTGARAPPIFGATSSCQPSIF